MRGVVYPARVTVNAVSDKIDTLPFRSCGGADGIVNVSCWGESGVRSNPPPSAKDGVIKIVPAVVPVWNGIAVELPLKTA